MRNFSFPEKVSRMLNCYWREKYIVGLNEYLMDDDNFQDDSLYLVNTWLAEKKTMTQSEVVAAYFIDEQVKEILGMLKEEFVVRMSNSEIVENNYDDDKAYNAPFKYLSIVECVEFDYDNKSGFRQKIKAGSYIRDLVTQVYFDNQTYSEKRDLMKREILDLFRAITMNYKMNYEKKMLKKISTTKGEILEFLTLKE